MSENQPVEPESLIDRDKLIALAGELKERGADFADEDEEHLREMPEDELMEYVMTMATVIGEDPEPLLVEWGVIEDIQSNRPDIYEFQNQGDGYPSAEADRLANDPPSANP